jgi:D-alanyl-D-alanine carboxypeptidase/D-alanyl-D-alanine-endopeptidase (penicillin-binding protein 4)
VTTGGRTAQAAAPSGAPSSAPSAAPAARVTASTITLALASGTTVPGRCVDATATVTPDATGSRVAIQRLRGGSWTTVRAGTLGSTSSLEVSVCFGWSLLGAVRLRAVELRGSSAEATSATTVLTVARAKWMRRVDALAAGHAMSVSVADGGMFVYGRRAAVGRAPASNEKLLLSMALLRRFGPAAHITTRAAAGRVRDGVVRGNLWILGGGDPAITSARLARLARELRAAGIQRIAGRVMGSIGYFAHDWYAPGWRPDFPRDEVALPTALTINGNVRHGVPFGDPERRAAATLTRSLRALGVTVAGTPGAGLPPRGLHTVATLTSASMATLLHRMDLWSSNFDAEILGKLIGASRSGAPGTIAKAAAAIRAFASARGVSVTAYDASGLSSANRVSARGVVTLLRSVESAPWLDALRAALPRPGEGTLSGRLSGLRVRAKTGTLADASALSGWVWVSSEGGWAEFSILSHGTPSALKRIENRIVRIIATHSP